MRVVTPHTTSSRTQHTIPKQKIQPESLVLKKTVRSKNCTWQLNDIVVVCNSSLINRKCRYSLRCLRFFPKNPKHTERNMADYPHKALLLSYANDPIKVPAGIQVATDWDRLLEMWMEAHSDHARRTQIETRMTKLLSSKGYIELETTLKITPPDTIPHHLIEASMWALLDTLDV